MLDFDKSLLFWINDILEDDPLPDEIRFLYFCIIHDKVGYHLEFKGSEIKNEYYFEYNPLEAQFYYFFYPDDINLFKDELILAIKNLSCFQNRKVFILEDDKLFEVDH